MSIETKDRILAVLKTALCMSANDLAKAVGVNESYANRLLTKLRLEGVAVPIGKSINTVWCAPEDAAEVMAQIEARQNAIRAATKVRALAARQVKRRKEWDEWGAEKPVQRIVPASAAKPPKVSVRCVWDLAA